jgi:hypothetical protein
MYFSELYPGQILVVDSKFPTPRAANLNDHLALYLVSKRIYAESQSLFYLSFLSSNPSKLFLHGLPALKQFFSICPTEYRESITGTFFMHSSPGRRGFSTDFRSKIKEMDQIVSVINIAIYRTGFGMRNALARDGYLCRTNFPDLGIEATWQTITLGYYFAVDIPHVFFRGALGKQPIDDLVRILDID